MNLVISADATAAKRSLAVAGLRKSLDAPELILAFGVY